MSISIKQGSRWFRPMRVDIGLVITTYEEAQTLTIVLQGLGLESERKALLNVIASEENHAKFVKDHGYMYDPEDKYDSVDEGERDDT